MYKYKNNAKLPVFSGQKGVFVDDFAPLFWRCYKVSKNAKKRKIILFFRILGNGGFGEMEEMGDINRRKTM